MKNILKAVFISILFLSANSGFANSGSENESKTEKFDPIHHVLDAHDIHIVGEFSIPLPIILWTNKGLVTFMSSEFHHDDDGKTVVKNNGMLFVKNHGKIYQLNDGENHLNMNHETHIVENAVKPFDFSITKVVVGIILVALIMFVVFLSAAKKYKGEKPKAPSGIA